MELNLEDTPCMLAMLRWRLMPRPEVTVSSASEHFIGDVLWVLQHYLIWN